MSQTFLTKSSCKGTDLEPIALVGHDAVLTRGRRSTKEDGALLTKKFISLIIFCFLINTANALNDETATTELTLIFNGTKPIDIVLVTRNIPEFQYGPIALDEIALLFACLEVNLYPEKIDDAKNKLINTLKSFKKYDPNLPSLSGYLNNNIQNIAQMREQSIIKKFDEHGDGANFSELSAKNSFTDDPNDTYYKIVGDDYFEDNGMPEMGFGNLMIKAAEGLNIKTNCPVT